MFAISIFDLSSGRLAFPNKVCILNCTSSIFYIRYIQARSKVKVTRIHPYHFLPYFQPYTKSTGPSTLLVALGIS